MTAEAAWAAAMKFDNRANPYPFFDELRKTPVARVADNTYVVTGYWELMQLAHDPRISSDISRSPVRAHPPLMANPRRAARIWRPMAMTEASSCRTRPSTTGRAVR